jgi:hypothetical protein
MAPFLQPPLTYDHAVIEGDTTHSRCATHASFDRSSTAARRTVADAAQRVRGSHGRGTGADVRRGRVSPRANDAVSTAPG